MFSLFRRSSARTVPATRTRLGVEALDRRDLPSVSLSGTTLTITGGSNEDVVDVDYAGAFVLVRVSEQQGGSPVGLGTLIPYTTGQVQKIVFIGNGDDDRITNSTSIPTTFFGGSGDNYASLGSGDDYVVGGIGDDTFYGGFGDDTIYGGSGDDRLYGNWGDDKLYGGGGYDVLHGLSGNDYLDGGDDGIADYLLGGTGADTFKDEFFLIYDPVHGFESGNRDKPQDFNYADGDQVIP
jgi:Ca2+-binding RTX toxin-like protein